MEQADRAPESHRVVRKRLPAGVADAAFASLATFAAGLSAVNLFDDIDRGVYAIFFTAFGVGVVLSWNLILIPAEVNAVSLPRADRMQQARQSLGMGVPASLIGTLAIGVAALLSQSLTTSDVIWGLSATAAATTVLSPLQDHMRRLLHVAELSWQAATVSGVQFLGVVISLITMALFDAPVAVMPFGSLAIANAISLATGIVLGRVVRQHAPAQPLQFLALAREGRWLLLRAAVPSVAHFVVASIVASLAGAEALGYAEAARVVAQPVLVLATGLTAVLAPRAMEAAMRRDLVSARNTRRIYMAAMAGGGLLYLVIAAAPWAINPMQYLVPSAYVVTGLVAVTVLTNLASAAIFVEVNELLGAQKARVMAGIAIFTSPIAILVALTAGTTEAFARPLGNGLRNASQIAWLRIALSNHYRAQDRPEAIAERTM